MSLAEDIKVLRAKTGAGLMDCKKALLASNDDMEQAIVFLRKKGLADMAKRSDRETKEGRVSVKTDGKNFAMIYLGCETDFVANTDAFKELCHNVAMHIAAAAPEFVSKDEIPAEKLEEERRIAREQVMNDEKNSKKPAQIIEKIVDGRIEKYCKEICLLDQPYVKDPDITIQTLSLIHI